MASVSSATTPATTTAPVALSKTELTHNVREWIQLEEDIVRLTRELKLKKQAQKSLASGLLSFMEKNNTKSFKIKEGFLERSQPEPKKKLLSKKTLLKLLSDYYTAGTTAETAEEAQRHAEELTTFVMNNRPDANSKSKLVRTIVDPNAGDGGVDAAVAAP